VTALLEVSDLVVQFDTDDGTVHAVNGISYSLDKGESLAIVGESGSGKSVAAMALMGLLPRPQARIAGGTVMFQGRDLLTQTEPEWRRTRGREIAMVYQDPMTSLNPSLSVAQQLGQVVRHHLQLSKPATRERVADLLSLVGIPNPGGRLDDYPHQFSGGQRQRLLIALALSCDPALLIADEPTTALDVTIQAQMIELVKDLREQLGMAVVWITHDLGVVAGLVDKVAVMYSGNMVESAPVHDLYAYPKHPYTVGLLNSLPTHGHGARRLTPIPGSPPDPLRLSDACAFAPRCPLAAERCRESPPELATVAPGHSAACFRSDEVTRRPVLAVQP
jgi:oligopeptide transport system ATP-binding protein